MASVGAFTIAFLAGFAAIGSFMIRQDMNYQRTVAAAAMMLIADRHAHATTQLTATGAAIVNDTSLRAICMGSGSATHPYLQYVTPTLANITFKGGDMNTANDKIFVFRSGLVSDDLMVDSASATAAISKVNLADYQNLIVTMSVPQTESDSGISFCQVSFWYGYRDDFLAALPTPKTTVEFLGRYLMADRVP
ncbi:MAG: hypothetical protein L6R48_08785 [Planctomycetes bacterium]|nr:hypothetical protein [Planctomycetota bacterium]